MKGLDPTAVEDIDGIEKAAAMVHCLIEEETNRGIPSHRIIVGGFSQGGALSLYSSLRSERTLGGVVALSCWLPLPANFPTVSCYIYMKHGNVVNYYCFHFVLRKLPATQKLPF